MNPLHLAARHGARVLVLGLLIGVLLPGFARQLQPLIPGFVVTLLFLSVLRISPKELFGSLVDLPPVAGLIAILQLMLPLAVLGCAAAGGWLNSPITLSLTLMCAAPSIVGSGNICIILGFPPRTAVRLMVAGSVLLPLTVLPVFWIMPGLGDAQAVLSAVLRLILTIFVSGGLAVAVRLWLVPRPSAAFLANLDGLSALTLAAFVVPLMPSLSEAALANPLYALGWLTVAAGTNLGLQVVAHLIARNRRPAEVSVAIGVVAGNRNIALFLASLPPEFTAPILAFVACYQIPMFLTPILLRRFYSRI